jgi:anoctamin-10/anoctamin-7
MGTDAKDIDDFYSLLSSSSSASSSHVADKASEYDYCAVFALDKQGELDDKGKKLVQRFKAVGMSTFVYKTEDLCFMLLRAPLSMLRGFAHFIGENMLLDEGELSRLAHRGIPDKHVSPADIAHDPEVTVYRPFEYIYAPYSMSVDEKLFYRHASIDHPFFEGKRLKLTRALVESKKFRREPVKIRKYIIKKIIRGFFPLHNQRSLDWFRTHWLSWRIRPWDSPFEQIKDYFGEKIGLYFVFQSHMTKWLVVPALIGLPIQIFILVVNDFSHPVLPFFSVFIVLWAIVMLEFWKRKEKLTAMHWGMVGFEGKEVNRPEFKGKMKKSHIDGSEVLYFPQKQRNVYMIQSALAISSLIMLVIGVLASIYVVRAALAPSMGSDAQTIASVLNAIQIQFFNFVYTLVADALAERENHRTDTEFEDSMVVKLFVFQFVNSYSSFFYLAFVASQTSPDDDAIADCSGSNCMEPLAINLAVIFGSRLATSNLTELLIPYCQFAFRYFRSKKLASGAVSRPQREFMLEPYDTIKATLTDYSELAISFGYIALFVTALPFAAFAGLVWSYVESKGDGWKLCNVHQRPIPRGAEDIGSWQSMYTVIAVAAVLTNAGITCFTMDVLSGYSDKFVYTVFIIFQLTCFAVQYGLMTVIPDEPDEVAIQLQRTEFLIDKFIKETPDDEYVLTELVAAGSNPDEMEIIFDIYPHS